MSKIEKSVSNEELLSKTIDWLRFPMVLLVIFVHSQGRNYLPPPYRVGIQYFRTL